MKVIAIYTTYLVEHDEYEYRTTDGKSWEIRLGESWEPAYSEEDELTRLFDVIRDLGYPLTATAMESRHDEG